MDHDNVALARRLYDAFAGGDVPTVLAAFDDKIEWREAEGNPMANEDGSAFVGADAIVQHVFMPLATDWEGFTVTPEKITATETGVVSEGRYTGVYKSTGIAVDSQFAHVWQINDGKLTGFQQYTDTATFRRAMAAD
jgi:ketosteroid isomerase-like protein